MTPGIRMSRSRFVIVLASLASAWLAGACSAIKSGGETFNEPPSYKGPGCYDHKGRIEPTIRLKAECDVQGWVWKTEP